MSNDPKVHKEFARGVSETHDDMNEYLHKLQEGNEYHYKQGDDKVMLRRISKGIVKMFKYSAGVVSEVITIAFAKNKRNTYTSDKFYGMEIPSSEVESFLKNKAVTSQTGRAMSAKKKRMNDKEWEKEYNEHIVRLTNEYNKKG